MEGRGLRPISLSDAPTARTARTGKAETAKKGTNGPGSPAASFKLSLGARRKSMLGAGEFHAAAVESAGRRRAAEPGRWSFSTRKRPPRSPRRSGRKSTTWSSTACRWRTRWRSRPTFSPACTWPWWKPARRAGSWIWCSARSRFPGAGQGNCAAKVMAAAAVSVHSAVDGACRSPCVSHDFLYSEVSNPVRGIWRKLPYWNE